MRHASPAQAGHWLEGLLHPLPLAMLGLLLLNDHVLKAHYGGWLTGKLSDVATLALLPFVLLALADLAAMAAPRVPAPGRRAVLVSILLSIAAFTAMQLTPVGDDAYRWGLAAAQWPFRSIVALTSGGPIPTVSPVLLTPDPSDLLALPASTLVLFHWLRRPA